MTRTTDIDAVLASWLAQGAEQAPEQHLRLALDRIAATPQRRVRAWPPRWRDDPFGLLAFVAAAAVLIIALGVVIQAEFVGTPDEAPPVSPGPVPSASAGPEPSADNATTFNSVDGSFSLRLPSGWADDFGPDVSATYVRTGITRLSIRGADAAGELLTCDEAAGPWEQCRRVVATNLDELADAIGLTAADEEGIHAVGPFRSSAEVDGLPARIVEIEAYEDPAGATEFVTYVAVVHEGRPYLLRLWTPGASGLDRELEEVLAGLSFGDGPSIELELFTNREEGYELLLPAIWASDPREIERGDAQAALAFGAGRGAGTRGGPALTIIVGDADGRITPCTCARTTVSSLEDLEELLVSTPSFFTVGPPEQHADLTLDGEAARSEGAGIGNNCLGCPQAYYHVYTIHDGRPYVLAFDYWTVRFRSIAAGDVDLPFSPQTLDAILDSFRFLDPSGAAQPDAIGGARTFVGPDDSFQVRLSEDWALTSGPDRTRSTWLAASPRRQFARVTSPVRSSRATSPRGRGRSAAQASRRRSRSSGATSRSPRLRSREPPRRRTPRRPMRSWTASLPTSRRSWPTSTRRGAESGSRMWVRCTTAART